MRKWGVLLAGSLLSVVASQVPTRAKGVAEFYKGKELKVIIPSGPGGGYDLYARFISRFIGKHIPGNPKVVVENMPGAGGLVAANYLNNIAPHDGLTLGEMQNTITLNQLAKTPSVRFDVRKFNWIGSMSTASTICALSGKAKNLNAKDLFKTQVLLGATAGSPIIIPELLNDLAGMHFKLVRGYVSTSNVQLAMTNGEVDGLCGWSWDGARVNGKQMFDRGIARVVLDIAIQPQPELKRDGVPFLMNLIPNGENKDVLKVILSTQVYNRPFTFPPGVQSDRVEAVRKAFHEALQDPEFQKEEKKVGLETEYLSGERIEKLIKSALDAPPKIQQRAVKELKKAGFN